MGKPVKKPASGPQGPARPEKKPRREPTPPSEESEIENDAAHECGSDCSHEHGGLPLPPLDIAVLLRLREADIKGPLKTLQSFAPKYRELYQQLLRWQETSILTHIQPEVAASLKKAGYYESESAEPMASFYSAVLRNAFKVGTEEFLNKQFMKVTSIALKYSESDMIDGQKKQKKSSTFPFGLDDIVPAVNSSGIDGDELFASYMTALTTQSYFDGSSSGALSEPFHALVYTFHFAENQLFSNKTLRLCFFTQGGCFYRQATPVYGRIVDVHADRVQWKDDESKNEFLSGASPFCLFRALFGGELPELTALKGSQLILPKGIKEIGDIVAKHLGANVGIPVKDVNAVDFELMQKIFDSSKVALPFMNPRKALVNEDEDEEEPSNAVANKLSAYLQFARSCGEQVADGKKVLTLADELEVLRRVVLVNTSLYYIATVVLSHAASNPLQVSIMMPLIPEEEEESEEDEEGDLDEEDLEEDEEDESDDEESAEVEQPKTTKQAKPPAPTPGKKTPECKHQ